MAMKRNAIKGKRRKIKLELDKKERNNESGYERKQKSQKNEKFHCTALLSTPSSGKCM
jgi:hypothetical protein